jgi:hypothetical protein
MLQEPSFEPSVYSINIRLWPNFSRSMPQYLQLGNSLMSSATCAQAHVPLNTNMAAGSQLQSFLFIFLPPFSPAV